MSKLTRSSAVTILLMVPDHHQRPQLAEWRLRTADLAQLHSVAVASVSVDSSGVKSWQEEQSPSNGIHQSWDRGPPLIGSNFPQQTIQPPCHPQHWLLLCWYLCVDNTVTLDHIFWTGSVIQLWLKSIKQQVSYHMSIANIAMTGMKNCMFSIEP